ncbi:MAG: molecular chaperone HscC [Clostridium sp.]
MAIIGIDLGTTNSLVAVWRNEKVEIIPNALNRRLTPSIVSVDENNEILVGDIAKERLITHPERTVANFKRFMGTSKKYNIGDFIFSPEELSSFILKALKNDAEIYLKEDITEAVISVPAYFNDSQRKATKRAGELAGLKVERLISEPTAAAVAYGINQNEETQFLIFDLGGGTFDVSILELFEGVMEVKSIAGDNHLGGEDFNSKLVSYFEKETCLDITTLDKKELSALYKQAEICKLGLSNKDKEFMKIDINKKNYEIEVTRRDFEKMCEELILRLRNPVERALKDADILPSEIDSVILVGGSTRIPIIRSLVSRMFKKIPFTNINPDETVALGAAIQGALKERNSELKEIVLTDVCPYTLGVEVVSDLGNKNFEKGYFLPIIERNSPIPISRVERLYTIYENQRKILINIFQGESRLVKNNIKLGELDINIPINKAGAESIDVRYTYDINGLLEVEVTVVSTGEKKKLVIEKQEGAMTKEEIEKALEKLKDIKIHPRDKEENRFILARGERLYEESLGEKRAYIADLLMQFERVLSTQNIKLIEKAAKDMKNLLDELEKF